jgi:hypothetical protein
MTGSGPSPVANHPLDIAAGNADILQHRVISREKTARTMALLHASESELYARRRLACRSSPALPRETDKYAALHVKILADQMELSSRQRQMEQASAVARELVSVAARPYGCLCKPSRRVSWAVAASSINPFTCFGPML